MNERNVDDEDDAIQHIFKIQVCHVNHSIPFRYPRKKKILLWHETKLSQLILQNARQNVKETLSLSLRSMIFHFLVKEKKQRLNGILNE